MNYTTPTSDWRAQALCATPQYKGHANLWFPNPGDQEATAAAKRVCAACPVRQACLRDAYETNPSDGIFAGLTHTERNSLRRRATRQARTQPLTPAATKQPPPQTLEEAFNRRTHRTEGGHVTWEGAATFKYRGTVHNALRLAFTLGHGREPDGPVDRTCGQVCFAAEHLIDKVLRASGVLCGTRRGYYWHHRVGEPACGRCRQANTDADNRLRRTGTAKAVTE